MEILKGILTILGVLFVIDIIYKVFFHGEERNRYNEEREKRQAPRFGD